MKRKVIRQGHNTLTVTLPRTWTKKLNISAGEEIDVVEDGTSLIVNGKQHTQAHCCEINITDYSIPLLWRYFQSAYRAGCTEIRVSFDPQKSEYEDAFHYYTTQFDYANLGEKIPPKSALAMIQEIVSRFIGIEIIESGKGHCVIREMGDVSAKEFESSVRRIFLVIEELFDRIIEAIEKNEVNDPSLCKEIHSIDLNIDKFVDYGSRILNRITGIVPEQKKQLIFSSLFLLELVGDEFKYIAKHLAFSKKPVKECLPLVRLVKLHFELYYKLYYTFARKTSMEFGSHDVLVYKENVKLKEKVKGESRSILKHLMLISKLTLSLVELRIQMEY